jgi:hypothetical protein
MRKSVLSLLSITLAGCMSTLDSPTDTNGDPQALTADAGSPADEKGTPPSPVPKPGDGPAGGPIRNTQASGQTVACPAPGGKPGEPLPPPPPPIDEKCLIGVKQCYADGVDAETCMKMEKECGVPAPCRVVIQGPDGGKTCAGPGVPCAGGKPESCGPCAGDKPEDGKAGICVVDIRCAGGKPEEGKAENCASDVPCAEGKSEEGKAGTCVGPGVPCAGGKPEPGNAQTCAGPSAPPPPADDACLKKLIACVEEGSEVETCKALVGTCVVAAPVPGAPPSPEPS